MRKIFFIISVFLITGAVVFYTACLKPPQYSVIPHINFVSLSKTTVQQNTDSLLLTFSFTDGDGDLGPASSTDTTLDIFLTDSRDHSVKHYQMPQIGNGGNIKAISGNVSITIGPFACRAGVTMDQLTYSIQIVDRAGHLSNIVQTSPPITIDCQ